MTRRRRSTRWHRAGILLRWHVLRRGRRWYHSVLDMPNNEADFVVRERRHTDEIRTYFPDYRTPKGPRR